MRKIKLFSLVSLYLLLSFNSFSQSHTLPQITPKSPNVAAMDKYLSVPVSLSTGMVKLDIPLYSFKVGDVTVPITLNHANNGYKPDEIASWVGHGWSLSCGGVISYQQRGLNDFDSRGLFANKASLDSIFTGRATDVLKNLYLNDVVNGVVDAEYDIYNYFLPSVSGSFYFTSPSEVRTIPKTDIAVSKTASGFKIRDDQGNDFYFEAQEFISEEEATAVSPNFSDNSSFYLSKIIARNGSVATFKYKSYYFQYQKQNASFFHVVNPLISDDCPNSSLDFTTTIIRIKYLLPDSIIFPEGYIKFVHAAQARKDLKIKDSSTKTPPLDKIEIYNTNNKKIKSFQLYTSYYDGNGPLMLDSLFEIGSNQISKKWKMQYNRALSSAGYVGKDHWGYLTNSGSSGTIPSAPYYSFIPNWKTPNPINYANKHSNFLISILGTLKSIEYPTGGKSEFAYEPNQIRVKAYDDLSLNPFMIYPDIVVGESILDLKVMDEKIDSGTFVIPEDGLYTIDYYSDVCSDPFFSDPRIVFFPEIKVSTILSSRRDEVYHWYRLTGIASLKAGTYKYIATSEQCVDYGGTKRPLSIFYSISHDHILKTNLKPYQVGGCRLSSVKTYSGITDDTLTQKYIYDDSLQNVDFKQYPHYFSSMKYYVPIKGTYACMSCGDSYRIYDESVKPLVGPVIEYKKVYELTDYNGKQGKIEHNFMTSDNNFISGEAPYPIPMNTYWRIGKETETKILPADSNAKPIKAIENSYVIDDPISDKINGLRVDYDSYGNGCPIGTSVTFKTNLATLYNESFHTTGTTETMLSDTSKISVSVGYGYASTMHQQPTEIAKVVNNKNIRQRIQYAFDYRNTSRATTSEATSFKNLITNHINAPIEQVEIVEKGGRYFVASGSLTLYKENGYVVDKVYQLQINNPVSIADFKFSYIDSTTGVFVKDSRYITAVIFNKYDNKQNIIEQNINNHPTHAYVWDYNNIYPVAEAINTSVNDIAYTSFEADGQGGFTGIQATSIVTPVTAALTGNKVYQLSAAIPITKTVDVSKKYIVSYWSNSGSYNISGSTTTITATSGKAVGVWKYYEHTVSGVSYISISGSGLIDELRVYPKGATMATYTYEPLIGLTSKCDADNRLLYYEYDDIGRLQIVRDQNRNILYKYEYQHQFICNGEVSRTYVKNNCGEGYKGSSVTYTIPAGKYCTTDINELQRKIDADLSANGQAYANANGNCIAIPKIYNTAISKTFSKNDCSITAEVGSDVVYTVPANKYFSYISQADANAKAQADIDANGQAYANTNGSCGVIYVKISYENQRADSYTRTADVVLRFYKDASCTQPYTIKGSLPVKYSLQDIEAESGTEISNTTTSSTITCTGASVYIGHGATIYRVIDFGGGTTSSSTYNYSLQENTGYKKGSGSL